MCIPSNDNGSGPSNSGNGFTKSLLNGLFGPLLDGVIVCDVKGTITFVNQTAERLLGLPLNHGAEESKNIVQSYVTLFESTRTHGENPCIKVLTTKRPLQNKRLLICIGHNNREHLVLESASPLFNDANECCGAILFLKDFTSMADEIRVPHKMESFKTLAGGMANDFNNLLTVINNTLFMARHNEKPGSELFHMLTNAEKASFQATMLTNQLLSIAGGGQPITTEVDLKQIIANITGFVVSNDAINYDIECDNDLSLISADRGMIDQAIGNVLENAVQAIPNGGEIRVRANNIAIDSNLPLPLAEGDYVCVSISDSGAGIPPENKAKVFDPFFTTKPGNLGLGLTLVYSTIRQHNGHVTVESNSAGTTVSMYFPSLKRALGGKPEKSTNKGRILFMDDETLLRHSAERIFTYLGYGTHTVNDGDEALAAYRGSLAQGKPFDIVILDLKVNQGRGGEAIIGELLALDNKAKVVISSGYISDPVVVNFEKYGFCGAIIKPYDITKLNATLSELVKKR
jgi:nitrogen-specific signal transduction histidine kinase/ActR/RegA family two-component response regulator